MRSLQEYIASRPAEEQARIATDAEVLLARITRAQLRRRLGVTQHILASRLGVNQPAVSRLERRANPTVRSLQELIAAMGGHLEIRVRLPGGDAVMLDVEALLSDRSSPRALRERRPTPSPTPDPAP